MKILIAGYAYIKENYFNTFNFYPEKDKIFFLLPRNWKAKGGKIKFSPLQKDNVYTASAYFYHSNYPLIGGLLKGWMPMFPFLLAKQKFDIVYSSSEPVLLTTLCQGIWSKLFSLKHIIFTWENISYDEKSRGINMFIKKIILKLNLFFCDGVICGNKKAAEIIRKFKSESPKFQILVCPLSGVDVEFFKKTNTNKTFQSIDLNGKLVFTFAGALGYRKGIHLILESMPEVIKNLPNTHLVIAGSGEYEESLKSKATSLKLNEYVTFVPWLNRNGLRELLSATDVFLYPSISYGGWEEQFGYSMAEASLMGVPIISTKTGSVDEVVRDNETGLLVDPDDVGQLTEAMLKLGSNKELRGGMGKAGRKFIENNFSYQVVANKFYNFFKSICA